MEEEHEAEQLDSMFNLIPTVGYLGTATNSTIIIQLFSSSLSEQVGEPHSE